MSRQQPLARGVQRKLDAPRLACRIAQLAQAVVDRQRKFKPARTAAHHRDAERSRRVLHPRQQRLPAGIEPRNGFHRREPRAIAQARGQRRRDARVDRQHIEGKRRAVRKAQATAFKIDARHGGIDKPRAGKARQRVEIHVHLLWRVVTGNQPWQHAGIRRAAALADQRDAQAGLRAHAKAFEHGEVGVTAAQQDEVGNGRRHALAVPATGVAAPSCGRADGPQDAHRQAYFFSRMGSSAKPDTCVLGMRCPSPARSIRDSTGSSAFSEARSSALARLVPRQKCAPKPKVM